MNDLNPLDLAKLAIELSKTKKDQDPSRLLEEAHNLWLAAVELIQKRLTQIDEAEELAREEEKGKKQAAQTEIALALHKLRFPPVSVSFEEIKAEGMLPISVGADGDLTSIDTNNGIIKALKAYLKAVPPMPTENLQVAEQASSSCLETIRASKEIPYGLFQRLFEWRKDRSPKVANAVMFKLWGITLSDPPAES